MTEWWHTLALEELSPEQWEALCDGCARCCLHKLEDEHSGEIYYTRVHCALLDEKNCRCTHYASRLRKVPECIDVKALDAQNYAWLPPTCAYRLRAENQSLAAWHPLVSGSAASVHNAGISVRGKCLSAAHVHPQGYDEHIINWVV